MKVPSVPPTGPKRQPVDPTFLAMAAADLHEAGLLFEAQPVPSEVKPDAKE